MHSYKFEISMPGFRQRETYLQGFDLEQLPLQLLTAHSACVQEEKWPSTRLGPTSQPSHNKYELV